MKKYITAEKAEHALRKILPYYFIGILIITASAIFAAYLGHFSYRMGDWLINYQGGMIRRGFLGEVVYQLARYTRINAGVYVVIIQLFSYGAFLFFSYRLLREQDTLLPYAFAIFSPFMFTFHINNLHGGYRKEIVYIAVFSFLTWAAKHFPIKKFERLFYGVLLLYPTFILSHEMLAVYLPMLLVIYLLKLPMNKRRVLLLMLFLFPSLGSFFLSIYYSHGTSHQVEAILQSLIEVNYAIDGSSGAINWLDKDLSFALKRVKEALTHEHYIYYALYIPLVAIAYLPIRNKFKLITQNKIALILIVTSFVGMLGLCVVGLDWGRFFYIWLIALFFLSFLYDDPSKNSLKNDPHQPISMTTIALLLLYFQLWHLPPVRSPLKALPITFTRINIIRWSKPYVLIASYYFPSVKEKALHYFPGMKETLSRMKRQ